MNSLIEIVTDFQTLLQLAREEAEARLHGTEEELREAAAKHEEYRQLCLRADKMLIGGKPEF